MSNSAKAIFEQLDAIFCDPDGKPCFQGSDGDRQIYADVRKSALTPQSAKDGERQEALDAWDRLNKWIYDSAGHEYAKLTGANMLDDMGTIQAALSSGRLSSKAEWQDISTAPKDGTELIFLIEGDWVTNARWTRYPDGSEDWNFSAKPITPIAWMLKPTPQPPIAGGEA